MTDTDLIARVWEGLDCRCTVAEWDEYEIHPVRYNLCPGHEALDSLSRRIQELREGLERIAEIKGQAPLDASEVRALARAALLHPEPQEGKQ